MNLQSFTAGLKNFSLVPIDSYISVLIFQIKMSIWAIKNVTTNPDIVKWIDHPCNHFLLGPIIKMQLKMNQKCEMLKVGTLNICTS